MCVCVCRVCRVCRVFNTRVGRDLALHVEHAKREGDDEAVWLERLSQVRLPPPTSYAFMLPNTRHLHGSRVVYVPCACVRACVR